MRYGTLQSAKEVLRLLRWLDDISLYRDIGVGDTDGDVAGASAITGTQVAKLVRDGMVRKFTGTPLRFVKVFTVLEAEKHRYRVIGWPRKLNDELLAGGWKSGMVVPDVADKVTDVWGGDWAVCLDLEKGFYQFGLSHEVQACFVFEVEGVQYCWTRMVMGFRPSAELCNAVLQFLVEVVGLKYPQVVPSVHVDNVRFVGTREYTAGAGEYLKTLSKPLNLAWNVEKENIPHQRGKFCGVLYDYRQKLVCLTDHSVGKLKQLRDTLSPQGCTVEVMRRLFGRLFSAGVVTQAPVWRWYYAIKWYRRRCRALTRDELSVQEVVGWWAASWDQTQEWLDWVIANVPTTPRQEGEPCFWTLFSDASTKGAGAVLVGADGTVRTWGISWVDMGLWSHGWVPHINQLEVIAAHWALVMGFGVYRFDPLHLMIDNTSALGAIRRQRSNSFWINQYVGPIMAGPWRIVRADYVASAENPADHPSRHH